MKIFYALPFLTLLVACSTPLEQCINESSQRYQALVVKIQKSEENISRGYAIHSSTVPYTYQGTCYNEYVGSYTCPQTGYRVQETPVEIDISQERAKLKRFKKLLPNARKTAEAGAEQCRAQFPEE
jgi:hypothetical protein